MPYRRAGFLDFNFALSPLNPSFYGSWMRSMMRSGLGNVYPNTLLSWIAQSHFLSLENKIALFSSETCWGVSKSASRLKNAPREWFKVRYWITIQHADIAIIEWKSSNHYYLLDYRLYVVTCYRNNFTNGAWDKTRSRVKFWNCHTFASHVLRLHLMKPVNI